MLNLKFNLAFSKMKNLIIASTSTLYKGEYLSYLFEDLKEIYKNTNEIIFIPYARPGGISYNTYTQIAATAFLKIDKKIIGLHTFKNPIEGIKRAKGIFTGGGNTFVLVNELHKNNIMTPLETSLLGGTPYLGTSAGSNICGITMQTTNDMPIVYTPSFKTLGVVPFNINSHYLNPDPNSNHMGETRETRIKEYHTQNTTPVVGLREGSWLKVIGNEITLRGIPDAKIFEKDKIPYDISSGTKIDYF